MRSNYKTSEKSNEQSWFFDKIKSTNSEIDLPKKKKKERGLKKEMKEEKVTTDTLGTHTKTHQRLLLSEVIHKLGK